MVVGALDDEHSVLRQGWESTATLSGLSLAWEIASEYIQKAMGVMTLRAYLHLVHEQVSAVYDELVATCTPRFNKYVEVGRTLQSQQGYMLYGNLLSFVPVKAKGEENCGVHLNVLYQYSIKGWSDDPFPIPIVSQDEIGVHSDLGPVCGDFIDYYEVKHLPLTNSNVLSDNSLTALHGLVSFIKGSPEKIIHEINDSF